MIAPRAGGRARQVLLLVVLLAAAGVLAAVVDQHDPIRHWLVFVYARLWLYGILFVAASLAAGNLLLRRLLPEVGPLGERFVTALALGVLIFVWGIFLAGMAGGLGRVFFFAWPALLLGAGGRRLGADLSRAWRRLRPFGFRLIQPGGPIEAAAAVMLVLGLVAVYLMVITPSNVAFDAQWYHLGIAEHYASSGRIGPFAEGWFLGTLPHLSSLLYTWAFTSPGDLFEHVALSSHLEWLLFLATLAGMAPLARRLLDGARTPFAAAALFLFPGIFVYDSSLTTMGDHVLAFWAPPLALALARLRRWFAWREAVVAALLAAGAAVTKIQSMYLVLPALLAVLVWTTRRRRWRVGAVFACTALAATSLYWLKNAVFHHDPFYPFLHGVFPARPFRPGAAALVKADQLAVQFALQGTPLQKVLETLKAQVTFSFLAHDWPTFHGERPIIGSLFTLLLPALVLVRARVQVWLLAAAVQIGVAAWFVTHHEDRFLQSLVPWMAAVTTALLVLAWRRGGWAVRAALALLVAVQVVSSADLYFLRTHAMVGDSVLKKTIDHLSAGHDKRYEGRLRIDNGLQDVAKEIPKGAKVLLHEIHPKLGVGAPTVLDADRFQLGIDYLGSPSPETTLALWRGLGITHVLWRADRGGMTYETLALEAVFADAMEHFGDKPKRVVGLELSELRASPARAGADAPTRLAWLGCGGDPVAGVYSPRGLTERRVERRLDASQLAGDPAAALAGVSLLILRPACPEMKAATAEIERSFRRLIQAGDVALWTRP